MEPFVPRIEHEHTLVPQRPAQRRARREGPHGEERERHAFELGRESHAHSEPRSPHEEGLGDRLDVTA